MAPLSGGAPRRTFAIISHPDAGKTTLTEKMLLYGGALELAGSVTARKNQRATASDWMELERQRGISISSTVLQFDYSGARINLLDTPGHKDFSEDTYRVLTAVDAAIMVIDAGKGIEPQTRKLFEVCRRRGVPIFTFMNKCDRPTREPLELLDELESVLGIDALPMNWPIGSGVDFCGVYDRLGEVVHHFDRTPRGATIAPNRLLRLDDLALAELADPRAMAAAIDEIDLLGGAGASFDRDRVLAGETTPVYFGSAMNNFGVRMLLDGFLAHSTGPGPRRSGEALIYPDDQRFSGFVFKIQANMDPRHRDRIAFIRIVSGRFTREMTAIHVQSGRRIRLSNSQRLFGQQRETVDEALPGDVVGIVGRDALRIGDTLAEDRTIVFDEIPPFAPECFGRLHNPHPANTKKFRLGLEQLLQEGVVRRLHVGSGQSAVPLLAAVGPLQFDVVQHRLETEYGAASRLEHAHWVAVRWLRPASGEDSAELDLPYSAAPGVDDADRPIVLFGEEYSVRDFQRRNRGVAVAPIPWDAMPESDGDFVHAEATT